MRAIVFVLRGCPVGCLGTYGNEWIATPNLDRFAAEAVVFDQHISDCPNPDAAGRAWLTGRHQIPPLTLSGSAESAGLPATNLLLATLREAGVWTVIVRANHPETDSPPPFYAGWDEVFDARPQPGDNSPLDVLVRSFPSLLDKLGTMPRWLLWVETDRLLPPWDVPQEVFEAYVEDEDDEPTLAEVDEEESEDEEDKTEEDGRGEEASEVEPDGPVTPFADPPTGLFDRADLVAWEWLHRSFAAVVTTLDAELGRLFDELRPRGLDQTASWILTSDFGYPLGEHGQVGLFRPWLHEELVHLPLLVRLPGAAEAGRRVAGFTQPTDLNPTLLDLFSALPTGVAPRNSLLPCIRGERPPERSATCSGLEIGGAKEWAVRTAGWTLLWPGVQAEGDSPRSPLLFEKPDDRWEVNDLGRRETGKVEELAELLKQAVATER